MVSADITILRAHVEEMYAHARDINPAECCGLIGGRNNQAQTLYPLRNVARDPLVAYEAAPEDLFSAQRLMRERDEQLLAIYHSHPHTHDPVPSETDVRLAFYPSAIYLIIGLGGGEGVLRAFRIFESEKRWERIEFRVIEE